MFHRIIPSDRSFLSLLPGELEGVREWCGMTDLAFHNLVVVVTEAVVNAIVHGNREEREKEVEIRITCEERGVRCVVRDQGEGFLVDEAPDPVAPENLLREGGRGIFIIRALTTELEVERIEGGSRISFLLDRKGALAADEPDEKGGGS